MEVVIAPGGFSGRPEAADKSRAVRVTTSAEKCGHADEKSFSRSRQRPYGNIEHRTSNVAIKDGSDGFIRLCVLNQ